MKRQRQSKGADGADHETSSDVSEATVHEIHRVIRRALTSQMMEIGQYVLDTVFKGAPLRALSAPPRTSTAERKALPPPRRSYARGRVNRIRRNREPQGMSGAVLNRR